MGGGVNGSAEMDAVTHSFKRLGTIGGVRSCITAAEKNGGRGVGWGGRFIFKMGILYLNAEEEKRETDQ